MVDLDREHEAKKRGGGWKRITLSDGLIAGKDNAIDLLELNDALERLTVLDRRQGQMAETRIFG